MASFEAETLIRDYVFVDNPRVRSHLAQLLGGVPEEEQGKITRSWQAGLRQIAVMNKGGSEETTESRSIANLHAAMLEEQASAAEMLPDLTELAAKPSVWTKGRFRKILKPGALIKIHAQTQLIAASEITDLVNKLDLFTNANPIAVPVRQILDTLYGSALGIRVFPCGTGTPERVFSGLFADVGDYIGSERPLLIPRFGSEAQELTCILQITRVPMNGLGEIAVTRQSFEAVARELADSGSRLDRGKIEVMLQRMLRMLEDAGVLEAPAFPAVGVAPIAVYRDVAPVSGFSALEAQLIAEG